MHIATPFDTDPFANTFVHCKCCGAWENVAFGNSVCSSCGQPFDDSEDTIRGIYPPGFEVE